jgi:hypothetical protein
MQRHQLTNFNQSTLVFMIAKLNLFVLLAINWLYYGYLALALIRWQIFICFQLGIC